MRSIDRLRASIIVTTGILALLSACTASSERKGQDDQLPPARAEVVVDVNSPGSTVSPIAFGIHTSVYDNALHAAELPERLAESGITLLRYPGGGYSDNYHWSIHEMTPFSDGRAGYLAPKSDFGSFVSVLERTSTTAMITVNYGSNLDGTGPGEPKEAAAWVAYANGQPDNQTEIGLDSTGHDWKTVGYWANLRASSPLSSDDGHNFLRIAHPAPLAIQYWEVGNEVFGNGYYATDGTGFEFDLHLPYDATTVGARFGHEALSPTTYGRSWLEFARAMRAVDPTVRVGAVLNTPPRDYQWGPTWNAEVLAQCGEEVDFVVVHYYPNGTASALMDAPRADVPLIFSELRESFAAYAGKNAANIEVAVTELGPNSNGSSNEDLMATGIFATEAYVTFMEYGAVNLDWLELHKSPNGNFLDERTNAVGPAFQGIRMAHEFVGPGDTFVKAKSTILGLAAHAAVRSDGSLSLLFVNASTIARRAVPVDVRGRSLAREGARIDYRATDPGSNSAGVITGPTPMPGVGDAFEIDLPPRSVTVLSIPFASAP